MTNSPTRRSFRAAVDDVMGYAVDDMSRRPAFLIPLEALPRPTRSPMPDLPQGSSGLLPQGLTVGNALRRMDEGSVSAVELARQCLEAIAHRDHELNAFVHVLSEDLFLSQAEELDRERAGGSLRGSLHGIPISIKDVIAVAGMPNTASSRVLEGVVADEDASSVRLLKQAGAVIMGKTQSHEFALGVTTPQSRNPWDTTRDPGGSSGGSAISVATGMSLASLATDTRASIRVPSAFCGTVGFKPTYGLVSTEGVTTLSWSLDHVGPLVRNIEDAAILLNVLTEHRGEEDYTAYLKKDARGLRVAVPVHSLAQADGEVVRVFMEGVEALRASGVEVAETDIPSEEDFERAANLGLIVSRCEAATYHRGFNADSSLYTRPVFEQLDEAGQVPAVAYLQAQRFRAEFQHRMLDHVSRYDALVMPTCRVSPPKNEDVEQVFLALSLNCIPWSFIGFPAASVPGGITRGGLPVGIELVAGPMEDGRLLALASALESSLAAASR